MEEVYAVITVQRSLLVSLPMDELGTYLKDFGRTEQGATPILRPEFERLADQVVERLPRALAERCPRARDESPPGPGTPP